MAGPVPPTRVRPAAVAGTFYPGTAARLRTMVDELLAGAAVREGSAAPAYVVPHAGYVYSGPVAAHVYRRIASDPPPRILLLGPTHRVGCRGLALPGADRFATPLGEVEVDAGLIEVLTALPEVATRPDVHADEHALEVQLPFLQIVARDALVAPVCVGDAAPEVVADAIEAARSYDSDTLVLVSSDLSHYQPDAEARRIDAETIEQVLARRVPVGHRRACGASPLNGLLATAVRCGWVPELLAYATSADTIGDRDRVVGYGAFSFGGTDAAH